MITQQPQQNGRHARHKARVTSYYDRVHAVRRWNDWNRPGVAVLVQCGDGLPPILTRTTGRAELLAGAAPCVPVEAFAVPVALDRIQIAGFDPAPVQLAPRPEPASDPVPVAAPAEPGQVPPRGRSGLYRMNRRVGAIPGAMVGVANG